MNTSKHITVSRSQTLTQTVLRDNASLPSHMYIGRTCQHSHGHNGKTLRYKSNHNCIICAAHTTSRKMLQQNNKGLPPRKHAALDAYDERQARKEPDPLFNEDL